MLVDFATLNLSLNGSERAQANRKFSYLYDAALLFTPKDSPQLAALRAFRQTFAAILSGRGPITFNLQTMLEVYADSDDEIDAVAGIMFLVLTAGCIASECQTALAAINVARSHLTLHRITL